jgi:Outer membrane protein beta-barrel domain
MIAHNRKVDRSAASSRWLFLAALLTFSPLSAWCQNQQDQNVEVSTTYFYMRANSFGSGNSFNAHGGSATAVWNVRPWLGVVADVGAYQFSGQPASVDGRLLTYTLGPRYSPRLKLGVLHPFAQFLFGGGALTGDLNGQHATENGIAMIGGLGLDARIQPRLGIRIIEVDYLGTWFDRSNNTHGFQNDIRVSTGLVFRFSLGGS